MYLGECSVICGALRHKYSHPPLATLPRLQLSGPGDSDGEKEGQHEEHHSYGYINKIITYSAWGVRKRQKKLLYSNVPFHQSLLLCLNKTKKTDGDLATYRKVLKSLTAVPRCSSTVFILKPGQIQLNYMHRKDGDEMQ